MFLLYIIMRIYIYYKYKWSIISDPCISIWWCVCRLMQVNSWLKHTDIVVLSTLIFPHIHQFGVKYVICGARMLNLGEMSVKWKIFHFKVIFPCFLEIPITCSTYADGIDHLPIIIFVHIWEELNVLYTKNRKYA